MRHRNGKGESVRIAQLEPVAIQITAAIGKQRSLQLGVMNVSGQVLHFET